MSDKPPRQPVFNVPITVVILIGLLLLTHAIRLWLPDATDGAVLAHLAFVPGRVAGWFDHAGLVTRLQSLAAADGGRDGAAAVALYFVGDGSPQPWTALTYAGLHGSWTHVGLNSIWLLAFGAPVARRLGPWRFLLLMALAAIAGALAHTLADPFSLQPLIGASASVSGCMGAAMRFVFQPAAAPRNGFSPPLHMAPRQSLFGLLFDRRALAFLIVWLASNFVTGIFAVPLGFSDMPIAWQAHVGGFVLGLLAFPLFDPAQRTVSNPVPDDDRG